MPSYDDAGTCSCSCEEGWKTFNIVGHASCIPSSAYNTFGYVGLILTLAHLIHAAYNVKQQVGGVGGTGENIIVAAAFLLHTPCSSMTTIAFVPYYCATYPHANTSTAT